MKEKFYLTTAIPYCSGKPHIGNTYEVILTDAIARYKRQRGYDVFFLTGTDEHGLKIETKAAEQGITPKEFVDGVSDKVKEIWALVGASYDKFIRTTDDYHEKAVAGIFKKLLDQGDIYKGQYEGWYCVPDEAFFTDTQVTDGVCPDCGRPVQRAKEDAYFFRMSKYADKLLKHMEDNPGFVEPEARLKEMINNFLKPGLQDLCVTRSSFTWGVQVPGDEKHVIYVWIDALSNYITAMGYTVDEQGELFKKYWPCDVHVIGKDIVRFHTIYWPILLLALGVPLPKKIYGHGWLNFGTDKMSKSKGNVMYADELAQLFGVDGVRYYTLSAMPYSSDGSITYDSMITAYNSDLANNLGNLVNRTISMNKKYFAKVVPAPGADEGTDGELKAAVAEACKKAYECMDGYKVSDALYEIFTMLRRANKYIDETTPWTLAKTEEGKARLATVMYNLLETIRIGAVLLTPFIPETAGKILAQLGTDVTSLEFGSLESGKETGEAEVLFKRIDEKEFYEQLAAMKGEPAPTENEKKETDNKMEEVKDTAEVVEEAVKEYEPLAETCAFDDFVKIDMRVAKVLECETVPKSKKLLRFKLDLGFETRQVFSGIAKYYTPEEMIGKKVVMVANLAPRMMKINGVEEESNGMIVASGGHSPDAVVKVLFADPDAPVGDRIS
ncbi:MAG: methionine--tRNA ligase [Ruminococcaceae bacterium]|nr:methionine--tRNA ligase [Oscillospiraceae bacterium]MBQ9692554.1 methionine--tRNA ligase [Clostridia bacterium]